MELRHDHPSYLLQGIADHGRTHLREVQDDLAQLVALVSTAVERMSGNVERIVTVALPPRDEAVAAAPADGTPASEGLAQAARSLITELQFHDMACQVAARAQARLAGMQHLLDGLEGFAHADPSTVDDSDRHDVLVARLETDSLALSAGLNRAVLHDRLETGPMELF